MVINFYISYFLIGILPISLVVGSAATNIVIILINIFFITEILINKKYKNFFNNYYFYLFIFFFIFLLINLFFSNNFENSFLRTFGFLRFVVLVFALKFFFEYENFNNLKKITLLFWLITFLVITFDVYFEFIFGSNILGNTSYMFGRISSFMGDELKIGNLYFALLLFSFSVLYLYYGQKKNLYLFLLLIVFLMASFIIGERSNYLKSFFACFLFLIIFQKKKFLSWGLPLIISVTLIFSSLIISNKNYNSRFLESFIDPIVKDGLLKTFKYSVYGAHYNTAYKIFLEYPILGVGLKNFRIESGKKAYEDKDFIFYESRQSTHPHQIHLEILSELGILGYISFILFFFLSFWKSIKNYLIYKNPINLSGLCTVLSFLFPMLPSGSFFSTYPATIFWISFALMITKFDITFYSYKK